MVNKVCFYNNHIYPLFNPKVKSSIGGAGVQIYLLSKKLSRNKNLKINVITSDYGQKAIEICDRVKIYKGISLSQSLTNLLMVPYKIWRLLRKVKCNTYVASIPSPETGIIGLFCRIHNKKLVYRSSSSIDCDGTYIRNNFLWGLLFKLALHQADTIVVQNQENQKLLKKNMGLKSIVVKNLVANNYNPLEYDRRKHILWVGRIEKNKNPEGLIKIAKDFPKERFIMIAPKANANLEYVESIYRKIDCCANITLIKHVPFDEIQTFYNTAKILACTSKFEGSPNVHLQAFAGKTPVVTLNINPDNYITKNNLGFFADGDLNKMISQTKTLLTEKNVWEKKSKNGYDYIKINHDTNKISTKWTLVIQNSIPTKNGN